MARLADLTDTLIRNTTGLSSANPGRLAGDFADSVMNPLREAANAFNPARISQDIIAGIGLGAVIPIMSRAFQSFIDTNKRNTQQFDESNNTTRILTESLYLSLSDMNENLVQIRNVLNDLYDHFTTESADEIERRREEEALKRRGGNPNTGGGDSVPPMPPIGRGLRPLEFLGGTTIAATLATLATRAANLIKFIGPLGIVIGAFASLDSDDIRKTANNIEKNIGKISDGDIIVGGLGIIGNITEAFNTGFINLADGIATSLGWKTSGESWAKNFQKKLGEWFGEEDTGPWNALTSALIIKLMMRSTWASALKGVKFIGLAKTLSLGVAGAAVYFGEDIQKWMESQGVPEDWSQVSTRAVQGAAIGNAMFGAHGLIAGAVLGIAFRMGEKLASWLQNRRDEMMDDQFDKIVGINFKQIDNPGYTLSDEDESALKEALSEIDRFESLGVSEEARNQAIQMRERLLGILSENERRTNRTDATLASRVAQDAANNASNLSNDDENAEELQKYSINRTIDSMMTNHNFDIHGPNAKGQILDKLYELTSENPSFEWNEDLLNDIIEKRKNPSLKIPTLLNNDENTRLKDESIEEAISEDDGINQANAWVPKPGSVVLTQGSVAGAPLSRAAATAAAVQEGVDKVNNILDGDAPVSSEMLHNARLAASQARSTALSVATPSLRPDPNLYDDEIMRSSRRESGTVIRNVNINNTQETRSSGRGQESIGGTTPQPSHSSMLINHQLGISNRDFYGL